MTTYYHGNSASKRIKIKNITFLVIKWQIVIGDKFYEIGPLGPIA